MVKDISLSSVHPEYTEFIDIFISAFNSLHSWFAFLSLNHASSCRSVNSKTLNEWMNLSIYVSYLYKRTYTHIFIKEPTS